MTLNEYQKQAARTISPGLTYEQTLTHALLEISSEVGEVHSIFQKELQGHTVDPEDLRLEIGDVLWGLAELCTTFGFEMDDIAERNIVKLKERYPDGFDPEKSIHRKEYEK